MDCKNTKVTYTYTGYFSKIVLDYLATDKKLVDFYKYLPAIDEINRVIEKREAFSTNRSVLVDHLKTQYEAIVAHESVLNNINLLGQSNTFTITTAHQPNIFTGPLYFIYKIFHAIKLAEVCKSQFSEYNFVPVYYMGSEDADLDELGHIFLNGQKLEWPTEQTGAVGRMYVDDALVELVKRLRAELTVLPYGEEIISIVEECYKIGVLVQDATLAFVNRLFEQWGLIVLIADTVKLKTLAIDIFSDELTNQNSFPLVTKTTQALIERGYKPQTHGRDINLFYLEEGIRSRIETEGNLWKVVNTNITFTKSELLDELQSHPEKFSPNVILRGLYQELLLPNLIFIGGGGELAYWLELKEVFNHFQVPYPMLVLRNSFLWVSKNQSERRKKLGFDIKDIFKSAKDLQKQWLDENGKKPISVKNSLEIINDVFKQLYDQANLIDITLTKHTAALQKQAEKKLRALEKKFFRAEKRNHSDAMHQIEKLKRQLFPVNNLQERIDNIIPYYALYGKSFLEMIYQNSEAFLQEFEVLEEVN